jgi:diguanylate cyclase (GGDEF)-like protein
MKYDPNKAIEIAENIFWVGHKLEKDPFQCHAYLIKNGKNSVLVDPGSKLTFKETFRKIESVVPFSNIRYIICHHQDPDITASLNFINELVDPEHIEIITHWRTVALLKHYDLNFNYYCVEDKNWKIDTNGLDLEFIFTPYLHFPGAFCTYHKKSKILFSSDLFGGFTDEWELFAEDEKYFDSIAAFHEHYMPSREILVHSLLKIEKLDIEMIAPQHGSIIKKDLIDNIITKLKNLDCGIFLLTQTTTKIEKLRKLNTILSNLLHTMATYKTFDELIKILYNDFNSIIPIKDIQFYTFLEEEKYYFNMMTPNHWEKVESTNWPVNILGQNESNIESDIMINGENLLLCIVDDNDRKIIGLILFTLTDKNFSIDEESISFLKEAIDLMKVALEREYFRKKIEFEREIYYNISIRDNLTNCYTRHYLQEISSKFIALHNRGKINSIGVIMIDIDDFKKVNDKFGHYIGDNVLKGVADVLLLNLREIDAVVRYGGEEFLVLTINEDESALTLIAERLRKSIEKYRWNESLGNYQITASFGIAIRKEGELFENLIKRADIALYKAKATGKNKSILNS